MTLKTSQLSIVMLGASGAVGTETLQSLIQLNGMSNITLLGRKAIQNITADYINQYTININDASSYTNFLNGHTAAICILGVGEPSKVSKEEFVEIDKTAVINFAKACKNEGVKHFELLTSVGINSKSVSFYLRTKGELVEELKALNFERLSIFQPSMILTPKNRYGISQAITLKVWPMLRPILIGSLRKYRGVPVSILGQALAKNIFTSGTGYEELKWDDFYLLTTFAK